MNSLAKWVHPYGRSQWPSGHAPMAAPTVLGRGYWPYECTHLDTILELVISEMVPFASTPYAKNLFEATQIQGEISYFSKYFQRWLPLIG